MNDFNWHTVENIIDEVLELPPEERESFIREKCRGNIGLKEEVTLLLRSITESEGWLDHPEKYKDDLFSDISSDIKTLSSDTNLIGTQVGSYVIREEIGMGGMGQVFRAERTDSNIAHQVAIKILRARHASPSVMERFKREQMVLARLNHPNIARFLDAGFTGDGSPYIIMEYVDGVPVHDFLKEENISVREKVGLFKEILRAVRYAHENLIIHRDLKPANILINKEGSVKILDFGISKLLDENAQMDLTQQGSRLLTPKYAAPEQILEQNITMSTDTYSLGVLFYYLLTDSFPYELEELTRYEAEQTILKESPATPSSKVSDPNISKQLSGDLDAILLKSIRKETNYRYRTAQSFLDDLEKFEQNLPVSAYADSRSYRLRKFFKRNRRNISIAAGFLIFIITLAGIFTWQLTQERNQARLEAEKAQQVKKLLTDIFEANDPISSDQPSDTNLSTLLEAGTRNIAQSDIDPAVKNELLLTLSSIYQNLTLFDTADSLASESLNLSLSQFGPQSTEAAQSYMQLGGIAMDLGDFTGAKKTLGTAQNILESNPESDKQTMARLYENLGYAEENLSNYDSSHTYFKMSLSLLNQQTDADSALYISVLRSMGRGFHRIDNHQKGDSLMLKALEMSRKFNGSKDIVTASVLGDLGLYAMTRANYTDAREYYNQSLNIKESVYGKDGHPKLTATLTNLGVLEETLGNFSVAESIFVRTMKLDEKIFGPDHPYVAMSKSHLGSINFSLGNYQESKNLYEQAISTYLDSYGEGHSYLGGVYKGYARSMSELGQFQEAEEYFKKSLDIYNRYETKSDADFAKLYEAMGKHYQNANNFISAATYFDKCATLFYPLIYDEYKIRAAKCQANQISALLELNRFTLASDLYKNFKTKIDSLPILSENPQVLSLSEKLSNRL